MRDQMAVAARLKAVRLKVRPRMSARRAAELLGWSHGAVSRREAGEVAVKVADLEALAKLYGVPVGVFYGVPEGDAPMAVVPVAAVKDAQEVPEPQAQASDQVSRLISLLERLQGDVSAAIRVADKNADAASESARAASKSADATRIATETVRQMGQDTHALVNRLLSPRPGGAPGGDGGDESAAAMDGETLVRRQAP